MSALVLDDVRPQLAELCGRHHVRRLSIFGSVLRDDFRPDSDIDVLVEFERDRVPGLIGLGTIELELSRLWGGRKVDLNTPGSLNDRFRQRVLEQAQVLFDSQQG